MTPPTAIIDSSVVVSGLLTSAEESPTRLIVDGMLAGQFPFLLSPELLAEYRTVLLRPKVRSRHGLEDSEVDEILVEIVANAILREPEGPSQPAPDSGDNHLWALLEVYPGAVLVTGDRLLLTQPPEGRSVLSARGFFNLLRSASNPLRFPS